MPRLLLALAAFAASFTLQAQEWPARPVKIVAPFAPGGTADTLGRLVAKSLSEQLKESFVVENRAGAGGVVGSEFVAKSPADGYTLVVSGIASHVIAPLLPGGTPSSTWYTCRIRALHRPSPISWAGRSTPSRRRSAPPPARSAAARRARS